jgi:endonuclease-3
VPPSLSPGKRALSLLPNEKVNSKLKKSRSEVRREVEAGPESAASKKRRLAWVCKTLEGRYGMPRARRTGSPLDVLIKTILSQNTNDTNRDRAYTRLKAKYPSWEPVASARPGDIARAIEPAGLFRQKSRAIKGLLRYLISNGEALDGKFLCRMESHEAIAELTTLKGIGIKTVSVALMFGCGRDDVFPVDTHVLRVSKRLEFLSERTGAEKAHRILGEMVPRGKAASLHLNLIRLGRDVCGARGPQCPRCALAARCPWPNKAES